ncbi:MAG: Stp1/IreP family PP2C-type Ser/Thr phosphatase [Clostridiales bacterium]|nr:Stp1/IreP family PP2C-type Ser/Thr phosphatase [Clostridiales bacterium]
MKVYGMTDIGCLRKDNQDSYAIRQMEGGAALLAVCDGMGGARAGSVASSVAVEAFADTVEEAMAQGAPGGPERTLKEACWAANEKVYRLSRENREYEGMGTTLVAALILPDGIWLANVGDSRCYMLEGDGIRQVTVDHSLVQLLVERGEITPAEARVHPQKNLITRALGVDSRVECDVTRLEPGPGGRLLLCSDGLTNVLPDETLLELSRREAEIEALCRALVGLTLERGAPDNVTAVLAQL